MTRFARLRSTVVNHPIGVMLMVGLCVAALGGAAELMAREALADRLRQDPALVGADTTVRQRGGWALGALTGQRLQEVDIVAENATLGPFTGVSLQVEVFDLRLGSSLDFERVHGLAVVDTESITDALRKEAPDLGVRSVAMNMYEGTISVQTAGTGVPKQLILKPEADSSGDFSLELVGGKAGGGSLISQGSARSSGAEDSDNALGLEVVGVGVKRDGLYLVMNGGEGRVNS
ncbi:hypothetical protein [Streptomyces chartreusis]